MTTKKPFPKEGLSLSVASRRPGRHYGACFRASWIVRTILTIARARVTRFVVLILLMTTQLAMVLLSMYLIDLGISLMELWAELARKHLELTL